MGMITLEDVLVPDHDGSENCGCFPGDAHHDQANEYILILEQQPAMEKTLLICITCGQDLYQILHPYFGRIHKTWEEYRVCKMMHVMQ